MRKTSKTAISLAMTAAMAAGMLVSVPVMAEEGPTFKVTTVRWTDAWAIDYLEEGFMKQVEEETGVNIDWQVFYNGDWSEQKSLLLASGDLPDAFFGSICLNATDVSQNKDYFVDLTDLITPENMPNLCAAFEACPELKAVCTDRDGRIYSLPKKLPLRPQVCGNVLFINQTWLDNLGLEVPTNIEELTAVLKAFAAEDANGDGDPTNEFPITAAAGIVLSGDTRNILSPFNIMTSRADNYMGLNAEGVPVFVPTEENYKEAVKWMRDLWEAGAVDPEYFTQESSAVTAKKQAEGGSLVGVFGGWTADAEVGANADQFTLLPAIEGIDGEHHVEAASNYLDVSDREFIITTACEDPVALLKWADAFYTDLASVQTFYGTIGSQLSDNGDGTYSLLIPEDGTSLDTSAWVNSMRDFGPKYMSPEFYDKVILPTDQGDGVKLAQDAVNGQYVTTDHNTGLPLLQYTEEELARVTTIATDINQYAEAMYAHWVVDGGVEDEWDAYVEQLNAMGLEELVNIHRTAYEAYLANMA